MQEDSDVFRRNRSLERVRVESDGAQPQPAPAPEPPLTSLRRAQALRVAIPEEDGRCAPAPEAQEPAGAETNPPEAQPQEEAGAEIEAGPIVTTGGETVDPRKTRIALGSRLRARIRSVSTETGRIGGELAALNKRIKPSRAGTSDG